jgi:heme exporter protein C
MFRWMTENLLAPKMFYTTTSAFLPWLVLAFLVTMTYGLIAGLFFAPPDYQQGDGFRIIYVHVPSAFTAMAIYSMMAVAAFITLVWRVKIAAMSLACSAPIGAWFTFLALITGSIWGKPMWGTWWIWDARLTSVLILFFMYMGLMALNASIPHPTYRERAMAVMTLVGVINLPIIHYSVIWWNTLHQGPTIIQFAKPAIAPSMLYPLLAMTLSFLLFYCLILFVRLRSQILLRENKSQWVKEVLYAR